MNEGFAQKLYLSALTCLRYPLSRLQHQMPDCTVLSDKPRITLQNLTESCCFRANRMLRGQLGKLRSREERELGGSGVVTHSASWRMFLPTDPFC